MSELLNRVGDFVRQVNVMDDEGDRLHLSMREVNSFNLRDYHRDMVRAGVPYDVAHRVLLRVHESREELAGTVSKLQSEVDVLRSLLQEVTGEIEQAIAERRRAGV